MNRSIFVICLVFAVTLATIFGIRASSDAIAVIIGVILGVIASVPTTALFTYLLLRSRPGPSGQSPAASHHQPAVVVVNPADKPVVSPPLSLPPTPMTNPTPQGRQWTMIGDEPTD